MSSIIDEEYQGEVQESFIRLFELKANGIISPLEEKRRKQLIMQYMKEREIEKMNKSEEDESISYYDLNCSCADRILKQVFVFFRLIDP
jgi:hypothetical protein